MLHFLIVIFSLLLWSVGTSCAANCTTKSLHKNTCDIGGLQVLQPELNINITKENCDALFNKDDFSTAPKVMYLTAESDKLYTLVMADPDAVNIKHDTYVLHWMVANIKGSDLITGDLKEAHTVKEYHPPSPPKNSGIHRYQFTIYTQDKKLFGQVLHMDRANFLLESWLDSTDQSVCGPLAGLQFRVEAPTST